MAPVRQADMRTRNETEVFHRAGGENTVSSTGPLTTLRSRNTVLALTPFSYSVTWRACSQSGSLSRTCAGQDLVQHLPLNRYACIASWRRTGRCRTNLNTHRLLNQAPALSPRRQWVIGAHFTAWHGQGAEALWIFREAVSRFAVEDRVGRALLGRTAAQRGRTAGRQMLQDQDRIHALAFGSRCPGALGAP